MVTEKEWQAQVCRRRILPGVYLFTFTAQDQVQWPHDHAQHSLNVIVTPHGYEEIIYKPPRPPHLLISLIGHPKHRWPFIPHFRKASTMHRIRLQERDGKAVPTRVLIFAFGAKRSWGFFTLDRWVSSEDYFT